MSEDIEHKCERLPEGGVSVQRAYELVRQDSWSWCLTISREATEEDLQSNHYLEQVGETIWDTIVEITHCPYCGESLPGAEIQNGKVEFMHLDCSGYYLEVL